ncbi:MAG: hypothetical protein VX640_09995 [Pseudomonadota bacterium]|nr:hypothetical protein [Pseudomonadota bacterium]
MKILKIEDGKGHFQIPGKIEWRLISEIDKDGLMDLLNCFLEQDVEMDEVDEKKLTNQAHFIIYRSIYEKLKTLSENKKKFKDESDRAYLDEIRKYSTP